MAREARHERTLLALAPHLARNLDADAPLRLHPGRYLEEVVCARFDHSFIYSEASEGEREIAAVVERLGMRTVALPFRSTAENMARLFYEELKPRIPTLWSVRVWETADSSAEYRP